MLLFIHVHVRPLDADIPTKSSSKKDSAQVFKAFDEDVWAVSITTNTGADRCDKIEFRGFPQLATEFFSYHSATLFLAWHRWRTRRDLNLVLG